MKWQQQFNYLNSFDRQSLTKTQFNKILELLFHRI